MSPLDPLRTLSDAADIVLFHHTKPFELGTWTKRDAFVVLGLDDDRAHGARMLCGGYQLYRAGPVARTFVTDLTAACTDARVLSDDPNRCGLENLPGFVDHRHDQSILSLLALKHGIATFPDPSQYGDHAGAPYPQLVHSHRERIRLLRPLETLGHVRRRR